MLEKRIVDHLLRGEHRVTNPPCNRIFEKLVRDNEFIVWSSTCVAKGVTYVSLAYGKSIHIPNRRCRGLFLHEIAFGTIVTGERSFSLILPAENARAFLFNCVRCRRVKSGESANVTRDGLRIGERTRGKPYRPDDLRG